MGHMRDLKAVIFDMDGVIVDSEPLSVASERLTLDKYRIKINEEDWSTFKGKTSIAIFNHVIGKYNVQNLSAEDMRREKMTHYARMFDEMISIFPGFTRLIEYLRPKYRIALTTSSRKDVKDRIFDKFQLHTYFDHIVTGDMVTNGKPHPEPYLLTLSKINLLPEECIVIEDSDNGIASAKGAGIKTIAVTHTFPKHKLAQSDFIVENLESIKKII
jgi:HAD superfamily hydrolase (TIGR01509 family)